jgi:hypothetical protein
MHFVLAKRWPKALWIASFTIILLMVVCELLARYAGAPQPYSALYVYDENLGYRSPVNKQVIFAAGGRTYSVFFDEEGIADRAGERDAEIIILGDGVTAGLELPPQDRLAHQLSRVLGGKGVVNLSITGYGTIQQALLLEEWLARHQPGPKTVILVFNLSNDVLDNVREWDGAAVPNVSLAQRDGVVLPPILPSVLHRQAAALYHESRLAGYLSNLNHHPSDERIPSQVTDLFAPQLSYEMKSALLGTKAGLAKLEQLSHRYGFKLYGAFWIDVGLFKAVPKEGIQIAIEQIKSLSAGLHWFNSAVPIGIDDIRQEWNRLFLTDGTRHANIYALNKISEALGLEMKGH